MVSVHRKTGDADKYCKERKCIHKGHIGGIICCDYILHMQSKRPHRISDCPGYKQRRIVQINMKTRRKTYYESVAEAAKKNHTSQANILRCIKKEIKSIDGFVYRRESFAISMSLSSDDENEDFLGEEKCRISTP